MILKNEKIVIELGVTKIENDISTTPVKINGIEKEVKISPAVYGTRQNIFSFILKEL